MKLSPTILIIAVVLSGLIGFFIGKGFPAQEKASATHTNDVIATNNPETTDVAGTSINLGASTDKKPDGANTDATQESVEDAIINTPEPEAIEEPEVTVPATTGAAVLARPNMGISDKKIGEILTSISENLEKKKLAYIISKGQDCSGIYHQIKDSIQKRLPALAKGPTYDYPEYKNIRSSRQIADWYYKKGNLLIVEDAIKSKNSIRPGSVMFFGKPNKKYSNITIDMLTDRKNNYTRNGAIMHIATVTHVTTDENGDVVNYTMMHGRNERVPASRSGSKEVQSKRKKGLPAFGNWSQQWVAVANIATKK